MAEAEKNELIQQANRSMKLQINVQQGDLMVSIDYSIVYVTPITWNDNGLVLGTQIKAVCNTSYTALKNSNKCLFGVVLSKASFEQTIMPWKPVTSSVFGIQDKMIQVFESRPTFYRRIYNLRFYMTFRY